MVELEGVPNGERGRCIGARASIHKGSILWSDVAFSKGDRPFQAIIQSDSSSGWIAWTDAGYSNLYTDISPRNNCRICLGCFQRIEHYIAILEIHQELADEVPEEYLSMAGTITKERVVQAVRDLEEAG